MGTEVSTPSIEVVEVKEHGLIFKSPCFFDLGTAIEMAIQLAFVGDAPPTQFGNLNGESLMNVSGLVVDCELVDSPSGEICYQATLLFENLDEDQKTLLKYASCLGGGQQPVVGNDGSSAESLYRLPDQKKLGAMFGPN